jgi:hypothetical protein
MMKLHHIHTRSWLGLAKTIHTYVYTVYIRYFWQGNHHTYGHIRCAYTVLSNPSHGPLQPHIVVNASASQPSIMISHRVHTHGQS